MLETPEAIKIEHQKLHIQLSRASRLLGKTGEEARKVISLILPHFKREEEFVFPQFATFTSALSPAEKERLIALSKTFAKELPEMLKEHATICAALEGLKNAAEEEGHGWAAIVAQDIKDHALMEEQVFYPAAILIGKNI